MENAQRTLRRPAVGELVASREEVRIARRLRSFASALGVRPKVAGLPSANVLPAILTGSRSWQAALRRLLGDLDFRNLKNYATGTVERSACAEELKSRVSPAVAELLIEILRDPGTAHLPQRLREVERDVFRLARTLHTYPLPWQRSSASWWSGMPAKVGVVEAALIDRTCLVIIGSDLLRQGEVTELFKRLQVDFTPATERLLGILRRLPPMREVNSGAPGAELIERASPMLAAIELLLGFSATTVPMPSVWTLADAKRHPFGNWLRCLMDLLHVLTPSELVRQTDAAITADSAMRYARGEMLTTDAAHRLTTQIPNAPAFMAAVPAARAMAFAIEFLMAADADRTVGADAARRIISARIRDMYFDVQVAVMRITRVRERAMLAAPSECSFTTPEPDWSRLSLANFDNPDFRWPPSAAL